MHAEFSGNTAPDHVDHLHAFKLLGYLDWSLALM